MTQSSDQCRPAAGSTLLAGFTTNYDKAGNKLYERHLHSECRSHGYTYDEANRLKQYQRGKLSDPGAWPTQPIAAPATPLTLRKALSEIDYNLDLLGNWSSPSLTSADGSTPPSDSRTHNALNQITQRGGQNLTYDKNGNLLNDGRLRYQYDALNRLRRVYLLPSDSGDDVTMASDVELLLVEYTYDALGRRIRRDIKDLGGGYGGVSGRVKAGVTLFLYAGNQCIEEREGTDLTTPARQYVWGHGVDELVQQREYNTPVGTCDLYPVQDLHNRTVAITDCCGSIAETYDTDAYGRTIVLADPGVDSQWFSDDDQQVPTPLCRFLYTGREFDAETGMYFYRARYYSPDLGRFIQRDPIAYSAGAPNLYELVEGRPGNLTDPTGNSPIDNDPPSVFVHKWFRNFALGWTAEHEIWVAYERSHGFNNFYRNNASLKTISTNEGGNWLLPKGFLSSAGKLVALMRPDIYEKRIYGTEARSGALYEIKSEQTGKQIAGAIAIFEVGMLNKAGVVSAHLGPSYASDVQGQANTRWGPLVWWSPTPGVILYDYPDVTPNPVVVEVKVPKPVSIPIKAFLNDRRPVVAVRKPPPPWWFEQLHHPGQALINAAAAAAAGSAAAKYVWDDAKPMWDNAKCLYEDWSSIGEPIPIP